MKFLRKTIMGVSALAFTAVALTTSTYAWFKIYSKASVQGLNLTANSGLGFMISVDGKNYKNDLTKEEIQGAILVNYASDRFGWKYDEATKTSTLYDITKQAIYDNNNNFIGYDITYDQPASSEDIQKALKEIELMPLTSKDGVRMTDLFDSEATISSGRYIEFQVYFKTTGTRGEYVEATSISQDNRYYQYTEPYYVKTDSLGINVSDGNVDSYFYKENELDETETYKSGLTVYNENYTYYKQFFNVIDITEKAQDLLDNGEKVYELSNGYMYEIYLNGEETTSEAKYSNGVLIQEATTISPTRFTSKDIDVTLGADMKTIQNGVPVQLYGPTDTNPVGDKITVYGGNALRMSITDENALSASGGTKGSLIYELNDSKHGDSNLGSYATNYSDLYDVTDDNYSYELDYEYGYKYSASYTYYTNLKQTNELYNRLMDFNSKPTTIKDLTTKNDDGSYTYNKKITTLSSGEDGKLITFRIWLEGWDADCFDGLGGTIQSQLSFSSKRIK